MAFDSGVFTGGAITPTFTAVLRISQAVYELKAVGEQTRDLLDTTKYVNSSLGAVRELRRKKSDILTHEEKKWMDQQIEFTQNAVDSVAVLIERARVDIQAKNETGNEDNYQTKHIKIHHRARFVLQDSPKVLTNLGLVKIAMNGLNSVMVTLSSREGHDVHLQPPREGVQRTRSPYDQEPPPPYIAGGFLNRRREINKSVQRKAVPQRDLFPPLDTQEPQQFSSTQTVPQPPLHSRASMSSIHPSINSSSILTDEYYENTLADETISIPACLPTAFIRDRIGRNEYFGPFELENTIDIPTPRNSLSTWNTTLEPPILDPKQTAYQPSHYQQHRASNPSVSLVHDEFNQNLPSMDQWASSTPHASTPFDTQKNLPMLPLNAMTTPSLHPRHSTVSFSSTLSNPSTTGPSISRGRLWMIDRAAQATAGTVRPISRTRSNDSGWQLAGSFDQTVALCREIASESLLSRCEDEEARFRVWAASLGLSKFGTIVDISTQHIASNQDAVEELGRLQSELSGYLWECMDARSRIFWLSELRICSATSHFNH